MRVSDGQLIRDLKDLKYRWHYDTIASYRIKKNVDWFNFYRNYQNERFKTLQENEKL